MKGKNSRKKSGTDWAFLSDQSDQGIDFSDIPRLTPEFWSKAKLRMPQKKESITLRLDPEVVAWFRRFGRGYQTRMNAVLCSYMKAAKHA